MTEKLNERHYAIAIAIADLETLQRMVKDVLQKMDWLDELLHDLTTPEAIARQKADASLAVE
jgi:hypothetical protein